MVFTETILGIVRAGRIPEKIQEYFVTIFWKYFVYMYVGCDDDGIGR